MCAACWRPLPARLTRLTLLLDVLSCTLPGRILTLECAPSSQDSLFCVAAVFGTYLY